jgi:hypothetical protein
MNGIQNHHPARALRLSREAALRFLLGAALGELVMFFN